MHKGGRRQSSDWFGDRKYIAEFAKPAHFSRVSDTRDNLRTLVVLR
jgi:hypothetical protein